MFSFDKDFSRDPSYILKNARVFINDYGFHYIDYFDEIDETNNSYDFSKLDETTISYLEDQLQYNSDRFRNQIDVIRSHLGILKDKELLDVGCGGGEFLERAAEEGAIVKGIELSDARGSYCVNRGLDVRKIPIESDAWASMYGHFSAVTIWDVIEHVNDPESVIRQASNLLKKGGAVFLDTPCRNSFYHRFGELTYRLTNGAYPTFLNVMYSSHLFGHKQIFSTEEITNLLENNGFRSVTTKKCHELTFPYEFYLNKMFENRLLINLLSRIIDLLFKIVRIHNKMYVIGFK